MQPWMSASQHAAQQSQQSAMRAAEQAARSAMDTGRAAADAAQRGAQFGARNAHTMHTGPSYRRQSGGGGVVSGFFRLVMTLIKLAMLAGIIAVAVVLYRGR